MCRRSLIRSVVMFSVMALAWVGVSSPTQAAEPVYWFADPELAWQQMHRQGRPVLVFVTTQGCVHCRRMENTTLEDPRVRSMLAEQYVDLRVDGNAGGQWLAQLKIRGYPTTLMVGPDGKLLDRIDGYVTADDLAVRLAQAARAAVPPPEGATFAHQ